MRDESPCPWVALRDGRRVHPLPATRDPPCLWRFCRSTGPAASTNQEPCAPDRLRRAVGTAPHQSATPLPSSALPLLCRPPLCGLSRPPVVARQSVQILWHPRAPVLPRRAADRAQAPRRRSPCQQPLPSVLSALLAPDRHGSPTHAHGLFRSQFIHRWRPWLAL
jgi:hypothetical protein